MQTGGSGIPSLWPSNPPPVLTTSPPSHPQPLRPAGAGGAAGPVTVHICGRGPVAGGRQARGLRDQGPQATPPGRERLDRAAAEAPLRFIFFAEKYPFKKRAHT